MKISRSLVAAALSGALVLGGTTAAIAQIPEAADSTVVALPASIVVDGVTYYKNTTVDEGKGDYKSADGKQTLPYLVVKGIVDSRNASESEETTEAKETTTEKTSEPKETTSATKSSEASESTSATKSSEASESTSASQTSEPSESQSAEPTPTDEPGDKKSSARDALSSKDGKPTPLAIFGIVAGVLAAVAAAFPVIAKTLNLNIKLPF